MHISQGARKDDSAILIAEDSATQAVRLQLLLEDAGHRVLVAANGRQALMVARKEPPWLIITDIMMPEMDGYDLCREVKSDRALRNIPVVLLTSLTGPEEVVKALKCGADNFMRKPYDDKRLLSMVGFIAANRQIRDTEKMKLGIELDLGGERYLITSERQQILDLLFSSFMEAVDLNRELNEKQKELALLAAQLETKVVERTAALQESEARYSNLVRNATYGIGQTRGERYVEVNQAMVEMLGYDSEAEVLALDLAHEVFRRPEDREEFLEGAAKTGRFHGLKVELKRKEGKVITVRLSGREVRDNQDHLDGYELIAEDITEREHLARQINELQKFEAIGRLAGGVAHDFNNHLGIILGYSELTLKDLAGAGTTLAENTEMIRDTALKAASLTHQLLAFSRRQVLEPKPTHLNRNVMEIAKLLRPLLGDNIELVLRMDPVLGRVIADPTQIDQVIMNLAVNARDAMLHGGRLTIETANVELGDGDPRLPAGLPPGSYVMLAVSDNGTGMDKEVLTHIFEPFFTTKEPGKGTGLGLATLYGIVKQSGGGISVRSDLGKGTTFQICLPLLQEASIQGRAEEPAPLPEKGSGTVLAVEDQNILRKLACDSLQTAGYTVLQAGDGIEALEVARNYPGTIHLLMTDSAMPGMTGRELAERLQALRPEISVLFVSGFMDESLLEDGTLIPGTSFLEKPFTQDVLVRKVREVLERPRQGTTTGTSPKAISDRLSD
jgi:two-component system, cell cycle sensor histidine kinase and response regulator CckA